MYTYIYLVVNDFKNHIFLLVSNSWGKEWQLSNSTLSLENSDSRPCIPKCTMQRRLWENNETSTAHSHFKVNCCLKVSHFTLVNFGIRCIHFLNITHSFLNVCGYPQYTGRIQCEVLTTLPILSS